MFMDDMEIYGLMFILFFSTYASFKKVEKQLPIALMISPVHLMPNSVLGPNSACLLDLSAQLQHLQDTSGASLAFSKKCCFPEGYLKIATKHQYLNIKIVAKHQTLTSSNFCSGVVGHSGGTSNRISLFKTPPGSPVVQGPMSATSMISISLSPALGCAYGRFDLTVIQRRLVNV